MKRKNEEFPEFDEIIFENRNKNYGAFDLRKRYKSVASLSILGGIMISAILITALSFSTEEGTASSGSKDVMITLSKPVDQPVVHPPEVKPPAELITAIKNLPPEVVTDSLEATPFIPITDVINAIVRDGKVTDSVVYTEPVTPEIPADIEPYVAVKEMPEYPGGNTALLKFISDNLIYPQEAQNINVQGRVILKFVVNRDGSVDRIEILKSIDPLLDSEAIRVVKILPKFKPGKHDGVPVPVWFTLPVLFKIENN